MEGIARRPNNINGMVMSDRPENTEQTTVYIKVQRLVCFLDRLDFEPGRNLCAAQAQV